MSDFFTRVRAVKFWKLLLFLLGWGLLAPFLIFVGGLLLCYATDASGDKAITISLVWTLAVLATFIWSCAIKLGYLNGQTKTS